jgi:hypothetical protein
LQQASKPFTEALFLGSLLTSLSTVRHLSVFGAHVGSLQDNLLMTALVYLALLTKWPGAGGSKIVSLVKRGLLERLLTIWIYNTMYISTGIYRQRVCAALSFPFSLVCLEDSSLQSWLSPCCCTARLPWHIVLGPHLLPIPVHCGCAMPEMVCKLDAASEGRFSRKQMLRSFLNLEPGHGFTKKEKLTIY